MLFLDIHVLQQCMVLCWHFTPHKHGNIFPKDLPSSETRQEGWREVPRMAGSVSVPVSFVVLFAPSNRCSSKSFPKVICWVPEYHVGPEGKIFILLYYFFIWNYQLKWKSSHQLSARVSMTGSAWPKKCISLLSYLPSLSPHGISFSISDIVFVFLQRPSAMSKHGDMHCPGLGTLMSETRPGEREVTPAQVPCCKVLSGSHLFKTCPALQAFGLDRSLAQRSHDS